MAEQNKETQQTEKPSKEQRITARQRKLIDAIKAETGVDLAQTDSFSRNVSLAVAELSLCRKASKITDEELQVLGIPVTFVFNGIESRDSEELRNEALKNKENSLVVLKQLGILYRLVANVFEKEALHNCAHFGRNTASLKQFTAPEGETPPGAAGTDQPTESPNPEEQSAQNPEGNTVPGGEDSKPEGEKKPGKTPQGGKASGKGMAKRQEGCLDKQTEGLPVHEIFLPFPQDAMDRLGIKKSITFPADSGDTIKRIVFVPPQIYVEKITYEKIKDKETGSIYSAKKYYPPIRNWSKSRITADLGAEIMTQRYTECQPGAQAAQNLIYLGLNKTRQSIYWWVRARVKDNFRWVWHRMLQLIYARKACQCDETYVGDSSAEGQKRYMWQIRTSELSGDPQIVVFVYGPSRQESVLEEKVFRDFITNFKEGDPPMWIVCDAYQAYKTLQEKYPGMFVVCGCISHMRSKFVDVLKTIADFKLWDEEKKQRESAAYQAVCMLKDIFRDELDRKDLSSKERKASREKDMARQLDEFYDWLGTFKPDETHIRGGLLDKAINYAMNQKPYLFKCLSNGDIPIHNNGAERPNIHFAKARNSFKMFGSEEGGNDGAVCFSLAATIQENGVNPRYYYKYLLEKTPGVLNAMGIDRKAASKKEITREMDLSALDVLMPWSEEYKKYEAEQREAAYKRTLAFAKSSYIPYSPIAISL